MTTQEELLRQIAENQKKNMALLLEKLGFLTSGNPQSGLRKTSSLDFGESGVPDFGKTESNYTEGNNKKKNQTEKMGAIPLQEKETEYFFPFSSHPSISSYPSMNESGVSNKAWIITVKLSKKISNMNTY